MLKTINLGALNAITQGILMPRGRDSDRDTTERLRDSIMQSAAGTPLPMSISTGQDLQALAASVVEGMIATAIQENGTGNPPGSAAGDAGDTFSGTGAAGSRPSTPFGTGISDPTGLWHDRFIGTPLSNMLNIGMRLIGQTIPGLEILDNIGMLRNDQLQPAGQMLRHYENAIAADFYNDSSITALGTGPNSSTRNRGALRAPKSSTGLLEDDDKPAKQPE